MNTISEFFSQPANISLILHIISIIILLFFSALASGSEISFFSLDSKDLEQLKESDSKTSLKINKLLEQPDKLLATILIFNNLVNIAVVLISTSLSSHYLRIDNPVLKYLVEVVFITLIIVVFGEIMPKIFANIYNVRFAKLMATPLNILYILLYPFVILLHKSTSIVNKRIQAYDKISINDISYAIDIATEQLSEEKNILQSVVDFGNTEVHEIMKPRVDVLTIDFYEKISVIKEIIQKNQYSRIPVVKDSLDNIEGILYIKDLILFTQKDDSFEWQKLIKTAYYVPENMKIDNLLEDFRKKKIHMAIVSDEYGGFSGIVTLEDVIEQIIGEINDEYDDPDDSIKQIKPNFYVIEGKLLLNDLQKHLDLSSDFFEQYQDIETIAGFLLEINGDFPKIKQQFIYKNLSFTIESISQRRIEKILLEKKSI